NEDERLQSLCSRYGGYWRYPKLLDFCFLVNPFFPPQKMKDEIKASFDTLLTEYPSGMRVNSLLASKNFNVHQENILVGNGAAELIKSLLAILNGKTGFVRPTFEEYPNRYDADNSVYFTPNNADYKYTEIDLITYFEGKGIDNLILVNPDNPSGNYIPNKGVNKLIEWCKKKNIKLVIDESFADFADEENNTHINQKILDDNPHVYVMKSISKSFGVPGLRLGILASGNMTDISILKKDVAIWNINSFAEFYMQIEEKYKKEYEISLKLLRDERKRFEYELSKIDGIRVIPSQANYIMVELTNQISSWNLAKKMLFKHNILIKELTQKITTGDYLRLAIRDKEDNDRLLVALNKEMQE
ncbi:MAG: histidinol-phosphate aminotransferase family protein, partial [Lachnospiraceae bacterium]|nr:histidinol-phosphate aminotransferase family protein [Lachnospiraceae bacterium]